MKLFQFLFLICLLNITACEPREISPQLADAPKGVKATQGEFENKVVVSWSQEAGRYFRVYRSTDPDELGLVAREYNRSNVYEHRYLERDQKYYYTIQSASNYSGEHASEMSERVMGYASKDADGSGSNGSTADKAKTPTSVRATDGTYSNRVRISWNGNGESYFKVYRSSSSSSNGTSISNWISTTSYTDRNVEPGERYYYRVRAAKSSSGGDISDYSSSNRGYAEEEEECDTPSDVEASDGDYDDKVRISWDGENCGYYKVYRSTSRSSDGRAITDWIDDERYTDYDISPGRKYYYRVKSAMDDDGEGASELSYADSGYAEEDGNTGTGSCLSGLSGEISGAVKIVSPYSTYNGNYCEIDFAPNTCNFNIHTPRRLSNGSYKPAPRAGDISLIYSSGWEKTGDNTWVLDTESYNSAAVWLPVNNRGDQTLKLARGAKMTLDTSGSSRKIIIEGEIRSPYQMEIEVTITF